jgi:hypothetical protein
VEVKIPSLDVPHSTDYNGRFSGVGILRSRRKGQECVQFLELEPVIRMKERYMIMQDDIVKIQRGLVDFAQR